MGFPAGARLPGGGFGRRGGLGVVGTLIVLGLGLFLGVDPTILLQDVEAPPAGESVSLPSGRMAQDDELAEFVSVVLADTEDSWRVRFEEIGRRYEEPTLVLFSGAVESACGFAQAAVGPFYCPLDRKLYIDLAFYRDLREQLQAPGDFAQAYVVAHEVGHHVQNLLGISGEVQAARRRLPASEGNALSVRLELQADCLSGLWAHDAHARGGTIEPGDIEEALNAAAAVGDDRLQAQSRGQVAPDSFTHGSSAQRVSWFRRGFESGDLTACDTFSEGTAAR